MWIPGHSGIKGYELADQAAKSASNMPLILTPNINTTDIKKQLKADLATKNKENIINCSPWYQSVNTHAPHTHAITSNNLTQIGPNKNNTTSTMTHKYNPPTLPNSQFNTNLSVFPR